MEKFQKVTGIVAPFERSNVDTDQIIPAVFLKRVTKTGYDDALFYHWRKDDNFVLNQPEYQNAQILIAGPDFGTGSSREHAALAPRFLGLQVALVKDFARIHWQNLVNFGILPITFVDETDYDTLEHGDVLVLENIHRNIQEGHTFTIEIKGKNQTIDVQHALSHRQIEMMLHGGVINWVKEKSKEDLHDGT